MIQHLVLLILLLLSSPLFAQMQVGGLSISADQSDFNNSTGTIELSGNVQIIFKANYLSSESAIIDRKNKTITAEGDVILHTPRTYAEADKLIYNYQTELGKFFNGYVQSGQVVFVGELIEKVSEKDYIATNAEYTACGTCPPAWSFSGSKIHAELGGYADISYPILKVGNIPIFILPKILVPLKSDRQSGFLSPTLEFSGAGGFTMAGSYFWAISKNKDMTLIAKQYETRGTKGLLEYRYVLTEESQGQFNAGYIYDLAFTEELGGEGTSQKLNRGYFNYEHYFVLPENYIQRTQLKKISDLRYMRDFTDELKDHGRSSLENKASITKNTERQHFYAEVGYNINLLQRQFDANNDDAVHRFPEVKYSVLEQAIGNSNFLFKMDTQYVNFRRNNEFSYDDVCTNTIDTNGNVTATTCDDGTIETLADGTVIDRPKAEKRIDTRRDGQFDSNTDLIRTGQRLEVEPAISYPIQMGNYFNVFPSLSFKETQYQFDPISDDYSQSAFRRYLQTDIEVTTLFSRIYGNSKHEKETLYKHEIEPRIRYSNRPWIKQSEHEFFGDFFSQSISRKTEKVTDQDFFNTNKIQFDYRDRLFNQKIATFFIDNRFIRKSWNGTSSDYQKIASFSLKQSYDFNEAESTTTPPRPWSNIDSLLTMTLNNLQLYSAASYFPYVGATNSSSRLRFFNESNDYFELLYTQSFTIIQDDNGNDTFDFDRRTEVISGGLGITSKYADLKGRVDYSPATFKVQSWRYSLALKPPGDCWGINFLHWQEIGTRPDYQFNFSFEFGGNNNS